MTDEKDNGPEDEAAEGAVKDKDNDSNSKDCPNGNNLIDFQQAKQEGRGAKKGNGTDRVDEKTAEEVRAQLTGIVGLIVDCTNKHAKFFQDPVDGICYARFKKDRHFEVWALNSDGFRRWLQWLCYKTFALDNQKARTPSQQILKNIIQVLEAHAVYNGRPGRVHLRTAFQDGRYYIDLCDDDWRVIQVEAGWWQNVTGTSVYFRRTPGMEPLPMPSANTANLNLLWQHINITHEGDRLIILTSLVAMLSPDIQFPFLEFTGQQGSGKTDTQEFLRM